jgi:hypothetical protein
MLGRTRRVQTTLAHNQVVAEFDDFIAYTRSIGITDVPLVTQFWCAKMKPAAQQLVRDMQ